MKQVIDFLEQLKFNNNREWFQKHKNLYETARVDFRNLVNTLIPGINKFDPSVGMVTAKDCEFRIYRDIRFSPDKTPYKTNFGAYIAGGGRKSTRAGYYVHIDTERPFAAGGMYMPPAELLKKVRQEIMYNADEFKGIIGKPSFKKMFGELDGDKLIRPPRDFPTDFPDIELLKYKSYIAIHTFNLKTVLLERYVSEILTVFRELSNLNRFLNRALD